jgi:hypothetical protein
MADRREQGGWILNDGAGGYRFQAFPAEWAREPCAIDIAPGTTPPSGTVAWVHTHPYALGEKLTSCEAQVTQYGTFHLNYTGESSKDDDRVQTYWTGLGYGLRAYIMDGSGIVQYDGSGDRTRDVKHARCGF